MSSPANIFTLEKSIWTEADFENMGWHDATIYGLTFEKTDSNWTGDLLLDIDYIFKWVPNCLPENSFNFWVSPCTLIFKEAFKLDININTHDFSIEGLEIEDILLKSKSKHTNGTSTYKLDN